MGILCRMKLQRKRTSLWLLLVDSTFVGICAVLVSGLCGSAVLRLPFHTDYRHYLVGSFATDDESLAQPSGYGQGCENSTFPRQYPIALSLLRANRMVRHESSALGNLLFIQRTRLLRNWPPGPGRMFAPSSRPDGHTSHFA